LLASEKKLLNLRDKPTRQEKKVQNGKLSASASRHVENPGDTHLEVLAVLPTLVRDPGGVKEIGCDWQGLAVNFVQKWCCWNYQHNRKSLLNIGTEPNVVFIAFFTQLPKYKVLDEQAAFQTRSCSSESAIFLIATL